MDDLERNRRIRNWMLIGSLVLGVIGILVGELLLDQTWIWFPSYVAGGAIGAGLGWLTTRTGRVGS